VQEIFLLFPRCIQFFLIVFYWVAIFIWACAIERSPFIFVFIVKSFVIFLLTLISLLLVSFSCPFIIIQHSEKIGAMFDWFKLLITLSSWFRFYRLLWFGPSFIFIFVNNIVNVIVVIAFFWSNVIVYSDFLLWCFAFYCRILLFWFVFLPAICVIFLVVVLIIGIIFALQKLILYFLLSFTLVIIFF